MLLPLKHDAGPNALRRGRFSHAGASYFVTACVEGRSPVLLPAIASLILSEAHQMDADESWRLRTMTVMPDHAHFYFTLLRRLTLSQCLARLKAKTREALGERSARWQDNFYDHRMGAEDSVEAAFRYIWLNPYKERLIAAGESWPWYFCRDDDWAWFSKTTDNGLPPPQWLV